MRLLFSFILCIFSLVCVAGNVDTISVYSPSMKKNIKCVAITPSTYKQQQQKYPVLYLLHGFGGNYSNWIKHVPQLTEYVDQYQIIIICPDGGVSSWYFDSPVDSAFRYETFVARELPHYVDATYNTIGDRKARAISGLSMGGHGALYLAWRHADYFGAAGSMSGALVIEHIKRGFHVEKRLGDTTTNRHLFKQMSIMHEMEKPPAQPLAIIIDCGTEDFIFEMSRAAHEKMLHLKFPHDYTERPGRHNWSYWRNAIKYQLLFFSNYFNSLNNKTEQVN